MKNKQPGKNAKTIFIRFIFCVHVCLPMWHSMICISSVLDFSIRSVCISVLCRFILIVQTMRIHLNIFRLQIVSLLFFPSSSTSSSCMIMMNISSILFFLLFRKTTCPILIAFIQHSIQGHTHERERRKKVNRKIGK